MLALNTQFGLISDSRNFTQFFLFILASERGRLTESDQETNKSISMRNCGERSECEIELKEKVQWANTNTPLACAPKSVTDLFIQKF